MQHLTITTGYHHRVPGRSVVYVPSSCKQSPHRLQNRRYLCYWCSTNCFDIGGLCNHIPTRASVG